MKIQIKADHVGQVVNAESMTGSIIMNAIPTKHEDSLAQPVGKRDPGGSLHHPVRFLWLASDPPDCARLALGKEAREVTQRLREATEGLGFDVRYEHAVRISDIDMCLLRHKPSIVHFSGHGSESGAMILEDNSGRMVSVDPAAIVPIFKILKDNLRCVVLNACHTERIAEALSEFIDFSVGMSVPIQDDAAILFACTFYQSLGLGATASIAFALACNRLEREGLSSSSIPRLFSRSGVDLSTYTFLQSK